MSSIYHGSVKICGEGSTGKSAYQHARAGGYSGSEEEYNWHLANLRSGLPPIVILTGATHSVSLENNTDYRCADIVTNVTINEFVSGIDGRSELWSIQFIAGDTITVAVPDTVVWNYGATPVFTSGNEYTLVFTPMLSGKVLGTWNEVEA